MKKIFLALAATAMLASCNNAPKSNDAATPASVQSGLKIAFVEVDSIMSQYTFSKEYQEVLQKKANNIQSTLASKQQTLQAAVAKLQQDYQANALTQDAAQARQAAIQKQGADLDALNQRLSNEFQAETAKFNEALRDSIQNYLKVYNKDKNYSLILTKAGDNILYADKKYDITNEVIAGLNKSYKPAKKEKADTKVDTKKK